VNEQPLNAPADLDLAVVMPAYNEAESIERVIREWWLEVNRHTHRFIFIVIDDGSTDETPFILSQLRSELGERLMCIRQENRGHGQACLLGYRCAATSAARHVLQVDSDGQCDPNYFGKIWGLRDSTPLVYGTRVRRDDGTIRVLVSAALRMGVFLATGVHCRDSNVPYRLARTSVVSTYLDRVPRDFILANVALAVLLQRDGVQSSTVPIRFRVRYGGQPSVPRLRAFASLGLRTVAQLRRLINETRTRPLAG